MADNFDNYSMKVQAKAVMPSVKEIDNQIRKLEKSISKLKVSGKFDDTALKNLTNQLNTLKATVKTANFSPTALNELTSQVNKTLSNINIGNINVGNQAQQAGQQIGQQINQGVSQGLSGNSGVLDTFRRSLQNIGMGSEEIDAVARRISNLGVQIESLNQSTSHSVGRRGNRDILSVDISGVDKLGQAIKLTEQYNMATGDLIRSMDSVSTAQQKAGSSTNTFAKQQSQAVANLTNQINQLNRAANDQNASRPITDASHLSSLSTAYNDIITAIQKMGNASSDTFVTEQNNVKTLISDYKSLVSEFRNAENVSMKMKGTDFVSGLSIARNDLEKFKADAKDFPQIIQTINNLDTAIANVGDVSSLNQFNDQLRVARSELAKIKSETSSTNRNEKVGINVSGLQSKIADLQRISPEIDKFEAEINGVKVTVQSLLTDLSKVNTQSDFSVINSKWKAFTDSAKSAGIAITEVATKSDSLTEQVNKFQLSFDVGAYDAKVTDLIAKTNQWTDANGNARISTTNLSKALDNLTTAERNLASSDTVANRQALIDAETKLDIEVKKTTNAIKEQNAVYAKDSAISSLHNKIQDFYDKNSATHLKWGNQLRQMLAQTASGANLTKEQVAQISGAFNQVVSSARQAGKLGLSFFDTLRQGMSKFSYWTSSTFIIMKAVQEVKNMINNVKELDDALTNISYTMDVSDSQLKKIGESSLQTAKDLNTSASNVLDAVKTYANATETAESIINKAKPTIMMSNVTGMGTEQTVDIIQGTIEQFDLEDTEEQLMHISDVLQTVSMSMPYDFSKGVKELSEGIQASGSVAKDAGYDLENYTALLGTLIAKTRQSGSELGRSLRTMFVRTTKASSSALANGEVTEDDLSNAEKALRRVGIEVRSDVNTFKDFDEIMGELYNKVDSLSEVDLSNIAYEVASTRQTNVFKMMIKAYGDYQDMAEKAYSADGATLANQEKYAESLTGKLTELSTIWNKIGDEAISSDFLKRLTDTGIGISSLIEKFGLLKTAIAGIGIYAGFKNVGVAQL